MSKITLKQSLSQTNDMSMTHILALVELKHHLVHMNFLDTISKAAISKSFPGQIGQNAASLHLHHIPQMAKQGLWNLLAQLFARQHYIAASSDTRMFFSIQRGFVTRQSWSV